MPQFKVSSKFSPSGDQPLAIEKLCSGIDSDLRFQTLLGITGSGKSATIAWTIEKLNRPALILTPNKSLAAQLAGEMKDLFPGNRVEFFVSYYDYYQPEAYVPSSDTFIEKDASVNEEIDRLRHSATSALLTRNDVIVVASVSAIYGLGSPQEYENNLIYLSPSMEVDVDSLVRKLVDLRYTRNDYELSRAKFRVSGDQIDIHRAYESNFVRINLLDDIIEDIQEMDPVSNKVITSLDECYIFPATHYTTGETVLNRAIESIQNELVEQVKYLESENKLLEIQRLKMRTENDLEMLRQLGYCNGIENYSRHIDGRNEGEAPFTLLDYFPPSALVIIDESHVTIPQLHGQYKGDRSRKQTLVDFGFRLPSALDNRPLKFDEFMNKVGQVIFMSATPSKYELEVSSQIVEQIIRPTGLLDPIIDLRPTKNQIDDLIAEIKRTVANGCRVLVTTLTKRMAEDLTEYLLDASVKAKYLHSDIGTVERIELLKGLREGSFDVLVGINLLREGLDLPEVSLVAILDADKEGFLRSASSLIQTVGRAARNLDGKVIFYADKVTRSMQEAMSETDRRRKMQKRFNDEHGIEPTKIEKSVNEAILTFVNSRKAKRLKKNESLLKDDLEKDFDLDKFYSQFLVDGIDLDDAIESIVEQLKKEMNVAASDLRFEVAAKLRDEIRRLESGS